jgi:hypothetical protein
MKPQIPLNRSTAVVVVRGRKVILLHDLELLLLL